MGHQELLKAFYRQLLEAHDCTFMFLKQNILLEKAWITNPISSTREHTRFLSKNQLYEYRGFLSYAGRKKTTFQEIVEKYQSY